MVIKCHYLPKISSEDKRLPYLAIFRRFAQLRYYCLSVFICKPRPVATLGRQILGVNTRPWIRYGLEGVGRILPTHYCVCLLIYQPRPAATLGRQILGVNTHPWMRYGLEGSYLLFI